MKHYLKKLILIKLINNYLVNYCNGIKKSILDNQFYLSNGKKLLLSKKDILRIDYITEYDKYITIDYINNKSINIDKINIKPIKYDNNLINLKKINNLAKINIINFKLIKRKNIAIIPIIKIIELIDGNIKNQHDYQLKIIINQLINQYIIDKINFSNILKNINKKQSTLLLPYKPIKKNIDKPIINRSIINLYYKPIDIDINIDNIIKIEDVDMIKNILIYSNNQNLINKAVRKYFTIYGLNTILEDLLIQNKQNKKNIKNIDIDIKEYINYDNDNIDIDTNEINQNIDIDNNDSIDSNIDISESNFQKIKKTSNIYRQDKIKMIKRNHGSNSKEYKKAIDTDLYEYDKYSFTNDNFDKYMINHDVRISIKDFESYIIYLLIKKPGKHYKQVIDTYKIPLQEIINQILLKIYSNSFMELFVKNYHDSINNYMLGFINYEMIEKKLLGLINYTVRDQMLKIILKITLAVSVTHKEYNHYKLIKKVRNMSIIMQTIDKIDFTKNQLKNKKAINKKRQLLKKSKNINNDNQNIYTDIISIDSYSKDGIKSYESFMNKLNKGMQDLYFNKSLNLNQCYIYNNKKMFIDDYLKSFPYLYDNLVNQLSYKEIKEKRQVSIGFISKTIKKEKTEALPVIKQFIQQNKLID